VTHTSAAGDFGFLWNSNAGGVFEDASESGRAPGSSGSIPGSSLSGASSGGGGATSRMIDPLANCELQAELGGYTSSRVNLANRSQVGENMDVGSIVLHRLSGDEGRMVSMLSLKAPKDAKKNFDKGMEQTRANKTADAAASFQKAVAAYPQYADAWLALGKAKVQLGARDEARADFQKAMDLDEKLVGPWQELGYMASDAAKWEDAARYLDQAVRLDPMDSPMAWYFGAMANYNLGRFDVAERDVRAEMKLDRGKNPRSEFLLGLVLIARKDLQGGADALRHYIASAPPSADVDTAKRQLSRIEGQLTQSGRQ
jgi:tetratricopeptide (TPR) repeat protein